MKCHMNKVEDKSLKGYLNIYEVLFDLFSSNQWEMGERGRDVTYKLHLPGLIAHEFN